MIINPTGKTFLNYQDCLGTVHNISFSPTILDSGILRWRYEPVNDDEIRFVVYHNGMPIKIENSNARESIVSGLVNYNRFGVKPISLSDNIYNDLGDWNGGTEIYLNWARCLDKRLAKYQIYYGTTINDQSTLLTEITTRRIEPRYQIQGDNSSHDGTVSIGGSYISTTPINDYFILTITGLGECTGTLNGTTITTDFVKNDRITFQAGIVVDFHDEPADYETNSTFRSFVGLVNNYETQTLPEATYYIKIKAVDINGNIGENNEIIKASIKYPPSSVSNVEFEIDMIDTYFGTLSWTNPTDLDFHHIDIYSNLEITQGSIGGRLLNDEINDKNPVGVCTISPYMFQINPDFFETPHTYKFLIKSYDTTGRTDDNIIEYNFTLPSTNIELLETPTNLQLTQDGNKTYTLTFDYFWRADDPCNEFYFYVGTELENMNKSYDQPAEPGIGFKSHTQQMSFEGYDDVDVYVSVASTDGSVIKMSDVISVWVDNKAPAMQPGGWGVPN